MCGEREAAAEGRSSVCVWPSSGWLLLSLAHQQDDLCSYHLSPACLSYRETQSCLAPGHCGAVGAGLRSQRGQPADGLCDRFRLSDFRSTVFLSWPFNSLMTPAGAVIWQQDRQRPCVKKYHQSAPAFSVKAADKQHSPLAKRLILNFCCNLIQQ